jgi:hypothetical protein
MATAGDRSASMGLAPGWRLTGVSGGQLSAEGPNGEQIGLGLLYQGIRPSICPFGSDPFNAYVCVINHVRQSKGMSPGSFKLVSSQNLGGSPQEQQVIQVFFESDLHDGKGPRKGSARIGEMHVNGVPTWALTVSGSDAPVRVADAENPLIMAMVHSYSQDARVIGQERDIAIGQIQASARNAQIRADAQSAANDSRNAAFEAHMHDIDRSSSAFSAHMDDIDRSSKAFQNYQLDQSVVRDSDYAERGTISNNLADALVKANPDRFQIVQSDDFIRGKDY